MAIKILKALTNGTSGDYWRIDSYSIDPRSNVALARMSLYKDAAHAAAAKASPDPESFVLESVTVRYSGGDFNLSDADLSVDGVSPLKSLYTKIKDETELSDVDFSKAADV